MADTPGRSGFALLQDARQNKSTAFTADERARYKLRGLLPAAVNTMDLQLQRALKMLRSKDRDIERYIYLRALQDRNERLFFRLVIDHIEETLPLIYTPTVGQACKEYAHIYRQPRGFYITPGDRGQIRQMLDNWPEKKVRIIVVTDGERILGLGDLGACGMGIPIGKLGLYTACAGIHPEHCMPVTIDVGTENSEFRNDFLYIGLNQPRLRGAAYFELIGEFIDAVQDAFPEALIQFEDFSTGNAYRLLHDYRDKILCFNDDIQGTAAVVLAGIYASTRISGHALGDLRIMFLGAGSASTGIADLLLPALMETGLSEIEARQRLWLVDSRGLIVKGRNNIKDHALPYANDHPPATFIEALQSIKPQILIGATGRPGMFTREVIKLMAEINRRPAIFALSNPTSQSECTAEQAYQWSEGRAIFASGSPFAPVTYAGREYRTGQGNNAYIFPGIGLGAISCRAARITDAMFLTAAKTLAALVEDHDLETGAVYPPLQEIREVSLAIASAVAEDAYRLGLAQAKKPDDIRQTIADYMYDPAY